MSLLTVDIVDTHIRGDHINNVNYERLLMAILCQAVKDVSARDEQVRLQALWWLQSPGARELAELVGYDAASWARGVRKLTSGSELGKAA